MKKVVVYIAVSVDGYIADKNKTVNWLEGDGSDSTNMGSYNDFYSTIDTVILGKTTYNQIVNDLSPNDWPYKDKQSYVITNNLEENKENITFTNNLISTITTSKEQSEKDIWICGGSSIINQLLKEDLVDKIILTIVPTILGNGIKLFDKLDSEIKLKLISTTSYNGFTDLVYEKRGDKI